MYSLSSFQECHLSLPPKEQELMLALHLLWLLLKLKIAFAKRFMTGSG
jgi:hypothetical protein